MATTPASCDPNSTIIHASCITYAGKGVIILGVSGSGKSALALQLMAYGADLVADDQTVLAVEAGQLHASAPLPLQGLIEARGIGLLEAVPAQSTKIDLVIDLDHVEQHRLPEKHLTMLNGVSLVCLHKVDSPSFPAAILHYLKAGRRTP